MEDNVTFRKDDLVGQQLYLDEQRLKKSKTLKSKTTGLINAVKNAFGGKKTQKRK